MVKKTKKSKKLKRLKKRAKKKAIKRKPLKKKVIRKKAIKRKKPRKKTEALYPVHSPKIRVIGIGGGGSSIINEIAPQTKRISFVAANTDLQALKKLSRNVRPFAFGQRLTYGLGTGMNPKLGQIAAETEREKIKKLLAGQDLCIFVSCLGGGTGSGATPLFVRIARELKILTLGIFTLPFKFEGSKKMQIARKSLALLLTDLNATSIIPNQRIFRIIDQKTPLKKSLSSVNKILAENLKGLIEFVYQPGVINIDFADLKTVLEGRGKLAYLNSSLSQGKNRIEEVVRKVLASPLYRYEISGAERILFNIVGGQDLKMTEVEQISKSIYSFNPRAKIIFGVAQYPKYNNKIKITLLASGCGPIKEAKKIKKKVAKRTKPILETSSPKIPKTEKIKKSKRISRPPKKRPVSFKKKIVSQGKGGRIKKRSRAKPSGVARSKKITKTKKTGEIRKKTKKKKTKALKRKIIKKTTPKSSKIIKRKRSKRKKTKEQKKPIKIIKISKKPETETLLPVPSPVIPPPSFQLQIQTDKVRKNALDLKREAQELEKELEKQEKKWDIPAFLRRKKINP